VVVVALVLVLISLGTGIAGAETDSGQGKHTSLTVTYWDDEQKPATFRRWTLACKPVSGTLPSRRAACRRLSQMTVAAFAPVPSDAVCTQIYGGPQKAVVKGTVAGERIWASFRRRNGCEIARWQRLSPWLLPPGGVTR
jgi:Subtilisin inhibitor-like